MNPSKFRLIILACLILTGCVSSYVANIERKEIDETEVFFTKLPARNYKEIKYIQVEGSVINRPEKLLTALTRRAKKEGADTIINVKFTFQFTYPVVSGVTVKYID